MHIKDLFTLTEMPSIGIIGLGRHHDLSLGYRIGKELFRNLGQKGLPDRLLVNSRSQVSVDSFFQQGIKEVLEQHLSDASWERRFFYGRKRPTCSVEDIVAEHVRSVGYELIAQETDLVIICIEAGCSTAEVTPAMTRQPDFRRGLYQANAAELEKITPAFTHYKGMVWIVTNPPDWLCMDFYEQTQMQSNQVIGIHPETHRLRDFTGLHCYLQQQGVEVHDLQGMDTLYVLGDHGGEHMVVPLSSAVVCGRMPASFDVKQVKKGIAPYVNQMANEP